jgi:chromosome segregation ATPase
VTLPQVNEADQMARRVTATSKALSDGERKIQERESELERLRAEPAEGDATELKELSELIHRAAAVETTANGLSARSAALDGLDRTLRSLHRNLTGAPADLEATRNLPVPARSRIEQLREQIEENRREAKSSAMTSGRRRRRFGGSRRKSSASRGSARCRASPISNQCDAIATMDGRWF